MSVVETTQALVAIPSVNPGYDPASSGEIGMTRALRQWAAQHSFSCVIQEVFPGRDNVILRLENGDGRHLLLNGHTDTVAVDNMSIPPFSGELREGRIWGRGSTDMKGPLACMLHALIELREQAADWRGTVTLACVVDEELGFAGIRQFLESGTNYDAAIVGEPTRLEVVRGCKGCLRFAFRAHGRAAHSSTPEQGVSAIFAMTRALASLEVMFAEVLAGISHPALGCSTGSVGLIRGGSGVNIVPDFCEATVDVRLVPGQSWQETYLQIQNAVEASDQSVRWEFDADPMADPPFCLEEHDPIVVDACEALGRKQSEVVRFSCDASKIAAVGIPCLIVGPGNILAAHTADESVAVSDLQDGVEAYVRLGKGLLKP